MSKQAKKKKHDDGLYPSSDLFNKEEFSDFKIKCQGTVFHVMKVSLASASVVFRKMLSTHTFKECQTGELEMKDADPQCVEAFLRYIYNNKPIQRYSMAKRVIELAEKYQMSDLKDMCETVLSTQITKVRLMELLNLAEALGLKRLRRACFAFGDKNPEPIPDCVAFTAKLRVKCGSTLCILHSSDNVVFDRPIFIRDETDLLNKVTCTLKPGHEVRLGMVMGTIDMYKVQPNGQLLKSQSTTLHFFRKVVPAHDERPRPGLPHSSDEWECRYECTYVYRYE